MPELTNAELFVKSLCQYVEANNPEILAMVERGDNIGTRKLLSIATGVISDLTIGDRSKFDLIDFPSGFKAYAEMKKDGKI